jgi:hypothetical protein
LPDEVSDWIENIAKCLQFDKASIQNELNNSKDSKETGEDELDDMTCKVNDYQINESFQACCQSESTNLLAKSVRKLDEFVLNEIGNNSDFHLSKEIFAKSIPVMDVVSTNSTRTNCFTKKFDFFNILSIAKKCSILFATKLRSIFGWNGLDFECKPQSK